MPNLQGFSAERFITTGTEIAYRTGGNGPALLLLHGYPQTQFMWHLIADRLAESCLLYTSPSPRD